MTLTKEYSSQLSLFQKKSVFKIVLELAKADRQIRRSEIAFMDSLQEVLGLGQEDLDMVHYISLQEAVDSLKELPGAVAEALVSLFEGMARVDNELEGGEKLLLGALKTALGAESGAWSGIVSAEGVEAETSSQQIIYLEDGRCSAVHSVFDDEYDFLLISKALGDEGLSLIYLPEVVSALKRDGKYELLRRSMGYLVPSGDMGKINNLTSALDSLSEGDLYHLVLSRYGIAPARIPSKAFLFLKLREDYVMDDDNQLRKTVDFLYMDISADVKKRVLSFVSELDGSPLQLSYEGYYKLLFDYLSVDSKSFSHIVLDKEWNFCLSDGEILRFESSPQARCFFLLLLHYGAAGVSQACFETAISYLQSVPQGKFDFEEFLSQLLREGTEAAILVYNTLWIYSCLSTKDTASRSFLRYAESILRHRSSLKNYVNKGFASAYALANREQYYICFNSQTKSYCLPLSASLFFHEGAPLAESGLWRKLR